MRFSDRTKLDSIGKCASQIAREEPAVPGFEINPPTQFTSGRSSIIAIEQSQTVCELLEGKRQDERTAPISIHFHFAKRSHDGSRAVVCNDLLRAVLLLDQSAIEREEYLRHTLDASDATKVRDIRFHQHYAADVDGRII